MKFRTFILGALALGLAGALVASRGDMLSFKNRGTGSEFRVTSGNYIVQSGAIGGTNALQSTAITGTLSTSGVFTATGGTANPGKGILTPTSYTLYAGTTVTPTSEFGVLYSTGGALTLSATPWLATTTATNGQHFQVMSSTTADIVIGDNDSVSGSLIELHQNVASRTLSNPGDVLDLRYYSGKWYEVAFSTH